MRTPFTITLLRAVFSVGSAVVNKYLSADRTGMRYDLYTGTLITMSVPPDLLAPVGAEQPRFHIWSAYKFRTTILAAQFSCGSLCDHTVSTAECFDSADWDAEGF